MLLICSSMTDSRSYGVSEAPLVGGRSVHRSLVGHQIAANPSSMVVPVTSRKPRPWHQSPSPALNDPSHRSNISPIAKGAPARLPRYPLPCNPLTCAVGRVSGASDAARPALLLHGHGVLTLRVWCRARSMATTAGRAPAPGWCPRQASPGRLRAARIRTTCSQAARRPSTSPSTAPSGPCPWCAQLPTSPRPLWARQPACWHWDNSRWPGSSC